MTEFKYIIFFIVIFLGIPIAFMLAKRFPKVEKLLWFLLLFFTASTEDINFFSMELYRGTSKGFEIGLVDITAMIMLLVLFSRREKYPLSLPLGSSLYFMYFTFSCISIINSDIYIYSFFELWKMLRMYLYFFVIYNLIRSFKDIEEFLKYMCFIVFFITVLVLKQKYFEGMFQARGPFPHQNSLVMYLIVYGSFFLSYLLNVKKSNLFLWTLAFGSCAINILSTLSRAGMVLFSLSIFIIFILSYAHKFSWRKVGVAGLLMILGTGVLFKASDTIMERIRTAPKESVSVRLILAKAAQNMANDKIFGIGLNNFALKINPPYTYGNHIKRIDDEEKGGLVETVYLMIAAETGWVNLAVFSFMLVFFYFKNLNNYMKLKRGKWRKYRYICIALIGALLSIYLQSSLEWVLKQTNNFYQLMFIFAVIGAISRIIKERISSENSK
ncbi:MAG: O-antigen ligase family protein [Campylobacteraceae bacterium]|nr:O-antigen ligase family protein [Campylobacteraceae bacterium]